MPAAEPYRGNGGAMNPTSTHSQSATHELRCVHCGIYFAMSDNHQAILPWDEDYERIICDIYGIARTNR